MMEFLELNGSAQYLNAIFLANNEFFVEKRNTPSPPHSLPQTWMRATAGLSKAGLDPLEALSLREMVIPDHPTCISHLQNIILNLKEFHKVLIPPHDCILEAFIEILKYLTVWKNKFLLLSLHCSCHKWGSAHKLGLESWE